MVEDVMMFSRAMEVEAGRKDGMTETTNPKIVIPSRPDLMAITQTVTHQLQRVPLAIYHPARKTAIYST